MWFNTYDDDGKLIQDDTERERIQLRCELVRVEAFLSDVKRDLDVEYNDTGDFCRVVQILERIRIEDPDKARMAEAYLNFAATIHVDMCRHMRYIERKDLSIDMSTIFA